MCIRDRLWRSPWRKNARGCPRGASAPLFLGGACRFSRRRMRRRVKRSGCRGGLGCAQVGPRTSWPRRCCGVAELENSAAEKKSKSAPTLKRRQFSCCCGRNGCVWRRCRVDRNSKRRALEAWVWRRYRRDFVLVACASREKSAGIKKAESEDFFPSQKPILIGLEHMPERGFRRTTSTNYSQWRVVLLIPSARVPETQHIVQF